MALLGNAPETYCAATTVYSRHIRSKHFTLLIRNLALFQKPPQMYPASTDSY